MQSFERERKVDMEESLLDFDVQSDLQDLQEGVLLDKHPVLEYMKKFELNKIYKRKVLRMVKKNIEEIENFDIDGIEPALVQYWMKNWVIPVDFTNSKNVPTFLWFTRIDTWWDNLEKPRLFIINHGDNLEIDFDNLEWSQKEKELWKKVHYFILSKILDLSDYTE